MYANKSISIELQANGCTKKMVNVLPKNKPKRKTEE